jgi:hypothetical protein
MKCKSLGSSTGRSFRGCFAFDSAILIPQAFQLVASSKGTLHLHFRRSDFSGSSSGRSFRGTLHFYFRRSDFTVVSSTTILLDPSKVWPFNAVFPLPQEKADSELHNDSDHFQATHRFAESALHTV